MTANQRYRKALPGTDLEYYDARQACEDIKPGSYDKLPYTSRILAENLVNRADKVDLPTLQSWLGQLIEGKQEIDFPWYPARVVCHDILGQTALVDLAGLRDAIAEKGGDPSKVNPVVQTQLIVDHSLAVECGGYDPDAFRKNREIEDRRNEDRFHFINWTKTAFENVDVIPAGNGIMHQINLEKMSPVVQVKNGVAFPDTCVGTDSHTPHVDSLGVISVGVGGLEAETVMLGRASMMRLPDIVGVELTGKRQPGITATDIVLALTEFLRKERVVGAFVEFFGEGARSLSIGDRATISNMTPEFGATAAMFAIDEQTIDYLKLTGRDEAQVKLVEIYAKTAGLWADALKTAVYPRVLKFDLSSVTRNMAGPSNPHARFATADLASKGLAKPYEEPSDGQMPDGAVVIAAITSCTNTSNPRNVVAAALLARNANRLGLQRKPWVKSSFAPGSKVAEIYLKEAGLLPEMEKLGFGIVAFACTTCNGMSGALDPKIQKEIIDRDLYATAVLSGNRNFDGRISPDVAQNYLTQPALVVAYALVGSLDVDLSSEPVGEDPNGRPVMLDELLPTSAEINAALSRVLTPDLFIEGARGLLDGSAAWEKFKVENSATFPWNESSTYIRRAPYFEIARQRDVIEVEGARALALLGDFVTTDHISPAGTIVADAPAASYLRACGVAQKDFNSYGSRRGNHEVMVRGTFANVRLENALAKGRSGWWTFDALEGAVRPIFDVSCHYAEEGIACVIIAGKMYGSGSSRDWAAKGPLLLGVRAVIAESFERIHRSNLVQMGIVPLEFLRGESAASLGIRGNETFSLEAIDLTEGLPKRQVCQVRATRPDGSACAFECRVRIDTPMEGRFVASGGILPYVLGQMASSCASSTQHS